MVVELQAVVVPVLVLASPVLVLLSASAEAVVHSVAEEAMVSVSVDPDRGSGRQRKLFGEAVAAGLAALGFGSGVFRGLGAGVCVAGYLVPAVGLVWSGAGL